MTGDTSPPGKNRNEGGNRPNKRPPNDNDNSKFEWRRTLRTLTMWVLIVVVAWILFQQFSVSDGPEEQKSFTQYQQLLENGQIASAEIVEREFHGLLNDGTSIVTILPFIDENMLAEWDSLKIDYQFKEKSTNWLGYLITSILPWIVIIGFWIYIMRRMQGGGGGQKGLFSFGKSRAKLMMESNLRLTFEDVAGCDEAKEELREVIEFLKDPRKFSRLGGRIPKGALLLGPPGTGKTLLARAVAGEAEVPFFSMSGADFVEMFVGVGAARVRDLFEQGKKSAPCIIFIDEIDAVGRQRGAGLGGGHDEREQTLNQLLVEMDGFESNDGVILIAATNRPDVLDPALMRPGRFDRQIVVDRPDVRGREGILKVHARKVPLSPSVRLDVLAKGTPGLSGADLANLVNEAALLAARNNAETVSMVDFENAKDKVMMGTERKSMLIAEDEKRQTAYHEAGHVLVAKMTPGSDPVHKVTIIPRGRALGVTHYLPMDEKHNYSRTYLRQNLVHLLGGRVAERIIFNELSTGAGNDIERATQIARKMVCEWGMSDKLGPIAYGNKHEEVFLGRDYHQQRDYSEKTAQEIDAEIQRIVSQAEQRADRLIHDNIKKLHNLAKALLDREILDGAEIDAILAGRRLPPLEPKRTDGFKPLPERSFANIGNRSGRSDDKPKPVAAKEDTKAKDNAGDNGAKPQDKKYPPKSQAPKLNAYGLASSRDPGNRRPSSRELANMDTSKTDSSEDQKDDQGSTVSRRRSAQSSGNRRRPNRRTGVRNKTAGERQEQDNNAEVKQPDSVTAPDSSEQTGSKAKTGAPRRRRPYYHRRRPSNSQDRGNNRTDSNGS